MDKQERITQEYYGEENLKDIYTQILKQEFIKDCEAKKIEGMERNVDYKNCR